MFVFVTHKQLQQLISFWIHYLKFGITRDASFSTLFPKLAHLTYWEYLFFGLLVKNPNPNKLGHIFCL